MRKLRFAGAILGMTAFLALAAGCGDNGGNPTGFYPAGIPGQAWLFTVAQPVAPGDSSAAILFANILAPPPSNGFRLYLNPADQGYRPATESAVPPLATTGTGLLSYFSVVQGFDPAVGGTIVARGARDGYETAYAPTTNTSTIPPGHPLALLRRSTVVHTLPVDSSVVTTANPTLTWQAHPGSSYLLNVFTATGFMTYSALVTTNTHQIGVSPAVVFENQPIREGLYNWSVQVVDGGYRVTGQSPSPGAFFVELPDPE